MPFRRNVRREYAPRNSTFSTTAAAESLARTPELLPVLKEAGVVDAGAAGYVLLLDVLLHVVDGRPVPKVIDFGIAKPTGRPLTDATPQTGLGAVVGTPEYMSPEQAELNNQDIDTRSDVYSLGCSLYYTLTGVPPFPGAQVLMAIVLGSPQ